MLIRHLALTLRRSRLISFCGLYTIKRNFSYIRRLYNMDQKKVVVISEADSESVDISFRFVSKDKKIDRIFNLKRKKEEQLSTVLARISANISKTTNKKKKKKTAVEDTLGDGVDVAMVEYDSEKETEPKAATSEGLSLSDKSQAAPDDISCFDAFVNSSEKYRLVVDNENYSINLNPPLVKAVDLPKCIMAGFPINVTRLKTIFTSKENCAYKWFKSDLKFDNPKAAQAKLLSVKWVECGSNGYFIEMTNEDVGCLLKVVITPYLENRQGEAAEVVSSCLVSAGPGECPFERRHQLTRFPAGDKSFRIISYNILADLYADSEHSRTNLFPSCPPYALDIEYRKQLLIKEILGYKGDIICLQEVDEKVFEYDLKPSLDNAGLEGYYDTKGGQVTEGLALFFRRNKLRILERNRFILSSELQSNPLFSDMWEKLQTNEQLRDRVSQRTTALQASVLESVEDPSKLIVVGITHLYFHPNADHVRILQGGICMQILKHIVSLHKHKYPDKDISLLFCGDFNSTPEFGIYRFMTTQLIDEDDDDWNSCPEECVKGISIHHDFEMESACGLPPYTNYTTGFYGCLDYIFYQTTEFAVKQVIPLPSHEEVTEHTAIPSIMFPSDHLPLIADIEFKTS